MFDDAKLPFNTPTFFLDFKQTSLNTMQRALTRNVGIPHLTFLSMVGSC